MEALGLSVNDGTRLQGVWTTRATMKVQPSQSCGGGGLSADELSNTSTSFALSDGDSWIGVRVKTYPSYYWVLYQSTRVGEAFYDRGAFYFF